MPVPQLNDDAKDIIWSTVLSLLAALLEQVVKNINLIPLGPFDKYKPLIILLAELLRKALLGGNVVGATADGLPVEDLKKLRSEVDTLLDTEIG